MTAGSRVAAWSTRARNVFLRWFVSYPLAALVVTGVSTLTFVLRRQVPPQLNMSGLDGLLYARQAGSIAAGDWLGAYDHTTLAKVPGYPLLIAAATHFDVALKDLEHGVALLAALSVGVCVLLASRRMLWALAAFVFCAFDPLFFSSAAGDVLRDSVFSSLSVLVVTSLYLVSYLLVFRRSRVWSVVWSVVCAALAGLLLAAYLLLREEGIAAAPMVVAALLAAPVLRLVQSRAWRGSRLGRRMLRSTARALPSALVLGVFVVLPVQAVTDRNEEEYGVALTSDWSEGAFAEAYGQWQRVEAGPATFRVPLTGAQRRAVYQISETARLLAPTLEDPENPWRFVRCTTRPICDYQGGWLPWALRDAAAAMGAFDSAREAQSFFTRVARDIDTACSDGRLTCRPRLPAALQPVLRIDLEHVLDAWTRNTGDLLVSRGMYDQLTTLVDVPDEGRRELAEVSTSVPRTERAAAEQVARFEEHRTPFLWLALAYTVLIPAAAGLGLVLLAGVALSRRGRAHAGPLFGLALALLVAVVTRLGLVTIVDAADFETPARYAFAAHTLLLAFSAVALAEGFRALDLRRVGELVRGSLAQRGSPSQSASEASSSSEASFTATSTGESNTSRTERTSASSGAGTS